VLHPIHDGVWGVEAWQPIPGSALPIRMTVIRLPDGGLWLHSPTPLDDATAASIDALGRVSHLVAPSRLHHLHLSAAHARWPAARVWIAPGLLTKRPDLHFATPLAGGAPGDWGGAIHVEPIGGAPELDEHVFFHAPSASLLVTDLLFNVHRGRDAMLPWILRLTGTWDHLAQSRVWWWSIRDRAAAAASARQIFAWKAQRLIPCHGDVLEDADGASIAAALAWMARG
jgi:hypothetical protein